MVNDNFDTIKNYTQPLLIEMVSLINKHGVKIRVFDDLIKKGVVLSYLNTYVYFENYESICTYLKDLYFKCKEKDENDYFMKHLKDCLDEVQI